MSDGTWLFICCIDFMKMKVPFDDSLSLFLSEIVQPLSAEKAI